MLMLCFAERKEMSPLVVHFFLSLLLKKNLGAVVVLVLRLNLCVYALDSSEKFGYLCAQKLGGLYLFFWSFINAFSSVYLNLEFSGFIVIWSYWFCRKVFTLLSSLNINRQCIKIYLLLFLIHSYSMTNLSFCFLKPFTGSSIDLGVAYTLMFMALVLTYLMHPIDAFPFNLF